MVVINDMSAFIISLFFSYAISRKDYPACHMSFDRFDYTTSLTFLNIHHHTGVKKNEINFYTLQNGNQHD